MEKKAVKSSKTTKKREYLSFGVSKRRGKGHVTRVYAWPNKELFNGLGYCLQEDLDSERYLLQFYYDNESNDIIGLRIVEFDAIDESLKSKLNGAGGVIQLEKGG